MNLEPEFSRQDVCYGEILGSASGGGKEGSRSGQMELASCREVSLMTALVKSMGS